MNKINENNQRPRISVFRSNKAIYAQIIDDLAGKTLLAGSSIKIEDKITPTKKAEAVGKELATKAKGKKITKVVFDRNRYHYHGQVKALAEGLREGGLDF
ncbi:MAG TPA: 50S ribosomal protein L18 [bacterium]|nr:50S ribosomal protein L18 [bacterium]